MNNNDRFTDIIKKFSDKKIIVIGDVMLDEFIFGEVNRINPEAPVPVLHAKKIIYKPGGAANTATNIASLGGKCILIGRVGDDESKRILESELKKLGITPNFVVDKDFHTTRKVRSMAKNQQLLRVDYEHHDRITKKQAEKIINLTNNIKDCGVIIISDYNKGVITKELMDGLKKTPKKILADIKKENKELFRGVHLIKPNLKEAQEFSGIKAADERSVEEIGRKLVKDMDCNILLTRASEGMTLFEKNGKTEHIPTSALEVYDVTGAGDTVIATLALCEAAGSSLLDSSIIANHAAGIVVGKIGTATTDQQELIRIFSNEKTKIKTRKEIIEAVKDLKLKNKKIVFTNGCYDILHTGHIKLLREAKKQGDILIVGLNTDSSVRKLKGPTRPINNEEERSEIMSSLEFVDYVTLFEEDTPVKIISELKPDIHVKGGDYNPYDYKQMPEAKIVHEYGGKIHIVKILDGKSTTNIIKKAGQDKIR